MHVSSLRFLGNYHESRGRVWALGELKLVDCEAESSANPRIPLRQIEAWYLSESGRGIFGSSVH